MGPAARALARPAGPVALALAMPVMATTDLDQTLPLIYTMLAISIVGAVITWSFLAYALWKFRDPATRGRKYG